MAVRREAIQNVGNGRAAKLVPVMMTPVMSGESGLLSQTISVDLDPVAGRMLSQTFLKVTSVFVPVQAMMQLARPDDPDACLTEVLRRRLMNNEQLWSTLVLENAISKAAGVIPKDDGVAGKVVSQVVQGAYNVAVNYLRRKRYLYATTLPWANTGITPAIIHETILEKFNGALDPDDHINGNIEFDFNVATAPVKGTATVKGIGFAVSNQPPDGNGDLLQDGGVVQPGVILNNTQGAQPNIAVLKSGPGGHPVIFADANSSLSSLTADLSAIQAGGFSLTDLYTARKADQLIRAMREIADRNPVDGEDAVLRWCYGLEAEVDRYPFTLYEERIALGERRQAATDGAGIVDEVIVSQLTDTIQFSVPIPRTELGGVVVTLAQVTPDEVVAQQPHPFFTRPIWQPNKAFDEMQIDPVPVTARELTADVIGPSGSEQKFYVGWQELLRNYVTFGFNRGVDPDSVNSKTVMWTYALPIGVSPTNILYPEDFSQYPFLDQNANVVTYSCTSVATFQTPLFFGPTPVEKVAIVDDRNLIP